MPSGEHAIDNRPTEPCPPLDDPEDDAETWPKVPVAPRLDLTTDVLDNPGEP